MTVNKLLFMVIFFTISYLSRITTGCDLTNMTTQKQVSIYKAYLMLGTIIWAILVALTTVVAHFMHSYVYDAFWYLHELTFGLGGAVFILMILNVVPELNQQLQCHVRFLPVVLGLWLSNRVIMILAPSFDIYCSILWFALSGYLYNKFKNGQNKLILLIPGYSFLLAFATLTYSVFSHPLALDLAMVTLMIFNAITLNYFIPKVACSSHHSTISLTDIFKNIDEKHPVNKLTLFVIFLPVLNFVSIYDGLSTVLFGGAGLILLFFLSQWGSLRNARHFNTIIVHSIYIWTVVSLLCSALFHLNNVVDIQHILPNFLLTEGTPTHKLLYLNAIVCIAMPGLHFLSRLINKYSVNDIDKSLNLACMLSHLSLFAIVLFPQKPIFFAASHLIFAAAWFIFSCVAIPEILAILKKLKEPSAS